MSEEIEFIKPVNKDVLIRDPKSKEPLNVNGEYKPFIGNEGIFWRRRVNDGSCIVVEKPVVKKEELNLTTDSDLSYEKGGNKNDKF